MELRHLRYFLAVADTLSFTRAAERQHTSQPSLSQQIRALEAEIGRQLFVRSSRTVKLTSAGIEFADYARRALREIEEGVIAARAIDSEANVVRVGFLIAAEILLFPTLLPKVRAQLPSLNFTLTSMTSKQQPTELRNRTIDIAFMRPPVTEPNILTKTIVVETINVIVGSAHPLAERTDISIADLAQERIIGLTENVPGLRHALSVWFARHGIKPDIVAHADNVMEYMSMVRLGVGVGLLPSFSNHILLNGLVVKPISEHAPQIELVMAYLDNGLSSGARIFVDTVSAIIDSEGLILPAD